MENQKYPQITNLEELYDSRKSMFDTIIKYNDNVIVANSTCMGFTAAVYEFIETPDETGLVYPEYRLSRIAKADRFFEDDGAAALWGFAQIKK